ncbi:MAG: hypothetical protein U9Q03_03705 [Patescibacteria group bacterium]|nr:hypothetical protein [Patescibacteria group bacterium]
MKRLTWTLIVVTALVAGSCAAGIRGGIAAPGDEEAVPERHAPTLVYAGDRSTVACGYEADHYFRQFRFGDISLSLRVPDRWVAYISEEADGISLQNPDLDAGMLVTWSEYPYLEVESIHEDAEALPNIEASPLLMDLGARHETTFSYTREDGVSGMFYGLLTRHDNPESGIVIGGDWASEHSDAGRCAMLSVGASIVITQTPPPCPPSG